MITRQELINQIEDYKPFNEQEKMDKLLLLNWIRNNDNAFSRENTVAHMTASAWVVNKDRSKVLMVYTISTIPGPGWADMQMEKRTCFL